MPIPKRWFTVSQDINGDPEGWELTDHFGDRSLRTWLQILVYLDRSENQWRLRGDWLATLSRLVRQKPATVRLQLEWLVEHEWLRVGEPAADGSPLFYEAPNWSKYNIRRETQKCSSVPRTGGEAAPLLTNPAPNLSDPSPKKEIAGSASPASRPRTVHLADDEFIAQLKQSPAYRHIDIDAELGKLDMWLRTPKGSGKKRTQNRVFDWMNRAADRQREVSSVSPSPTSVSGCAEKIYVNNGRTFVLCGKPIAPDQATPARLFCSDHLIYRERIDAQLGKGGAA